MKKCCKPGPEMPPRSLRVASFILSVAPTKGALVLYLGSSFLLLCHTLSVWVLLLLLTGLFVCLFTPLQFILLRMKGKTPVPSANTGPFPLYIWAFNHFFLYSQSIQGVFFTYQNSHGPDLTENCVREWRDFLGVQSLSLLLFPPALISPPQTFFPHSCGRVTPAGPDLILLLVLAESSRKRLVISLKTQTRSSFL